MTRLEYIEQMTDEELNAEIAMQDNNDKVAAIHESLGCDTPTAEEFLAESRRLFPKKDARTKLAEMQEQMRQTEIDEIGGKDPVLLAKAKKNAKMSWYDVVACLEILSVTDGIGISDEAVNMMREGLIEKKYTYLAGEAETPMAWVD